MFPTHDMNPIAIDHMQRERLAADTAFVDKHAKATRRSFISSIVSRIFGGLVRSIMNYGPGMVGQCNDVPSNSEAGQYSNSDGSK